MKNIFENVKFNDWFHTRDGRIAIFQREKPKGVFCLMTNESFLQYNKTGRILSNPPEKKHPLDIVARYKETFDEIKMLKLSYNYALDELGKEHYPEMSQMRRDYEAGYKEALGFTGNEEPEIEMDEEDTEPDEDDEDIFGMKVKKKKKFANMNEAVAHDLEEMIKETIQKEKTTDIDEE